MENIWKKGEVICALMSERVRGGAFEFVQLPRQEIFADLPGLVVVYPLHQLVHAVLVLLFYVNDLLSWGACMHGCMDGCMDGWMDGWVDGWMDGWMGGWMNA